MSVLNFDLGEALKWMGVATAPMVAFVTKKVLGSASKEELKEVLKAVTDWQKTHEMRDSERFSGVFSRLDEVAKSTARIEGYMQATRDASLKDRS